MLQWLLVVSYGQDASSIDLIQVRVTVNGGGQIMQVRVDCTVGFGVESFAGQIKANSPDRTFRCFKKKT